MSLRVYFSGSENFVQQAGFRPLRTLVKLTKPGWLEREPRGHS